jgi:peptidoglycan/LPS O-acetylase OafA/YrhL
MKNRNTAYDIIKIVAVISAMLVHFELNTNISQILAYSVPLLIFLSGILSSSSQNNNYGFYLLKRVKRIVFPSYVMICFVMIARLFVFLCNKGDFYSFDRVLQTIFLCDYGIGYIWITRIFLIIAVATPVLSKINNKVENDCVLLLIFAFSLAAYTVIERALLPFHKEIWFQYTVYMIPYFMIFLLGQRFTRRKLVPIIASAVGLIGFVHLSIENGFHPSSEKYPPELQYILYGIFSAVVLVWLFSFTNQFRFSQKAQDKFAWFSSESFNIYLVHATLIILYGWIEDKLPIHIPVLIQIFVNISLSIILMRGFYIFRMRLVKKHGEEKFS